MTRHQRRELIISWVLFVLIVGGSALAFHHARQDWLAELARMHHQHQPVATIRVHG